MSPLPINPPLPFRLDGRRAIMRLAHGWQAPEQEQPMMEWLHTMLRYQPRERVPYTMGPFGPRLPNEGYRYQLDGSNDWWAAVVRPEDPFPLSAADVPEPVLVIAARYDHQPLVELCSWAATRFGPR